MMHALFLLNASGRRNKRVEMALSLPAVSLSNPSKGLSEEPSILNPLLFVFTKII